MNSLLALVEGKKEGKKEGWKEGRKGGREEGREEGNLEPCKRSLDFYNALQIVLISFPLKFFLSM